MTTNEIKAWLRKCAAGCRNYEDHIMAESYEATLAKINADDAALAAKDATIAELLAALEPFAEIAQWDISDYEADSDAYEPMSPRYAAGGVLRVGHLRRAVAAIARAKAVK
jgi:hypothetical protein